MPPAARARGREPAAVPDAGRARARRRQRLGLPLRGAAPPRAGRGGAGSCRRDRAHPGARGLVRGEPAEGRAWRRARRGEDQGRRGRWQERCVEILFITCARDAQDLFLGAGYESEGAVL